MTNTNDLNPQTTLIDYLLDAITYGNRFDATRNERLGASSIADAFGEEARDWTRQQVREQFARWSTERDKV